MKRAILVVACLAPGCFGSGVVPGPYEMQQIYAELDQGLDAFLLDLSRQWDGSRHDVAFGTELLPANGHRGPDLLAPGGLAGTVLFLDRLHALGCKSVVVSINFPMLLPVFPRHEEYLAYYKAVAAETRRRGMKICAENGPFLCDEAFTSTCFDYASLTPAEYFQMKRDHAHLIAREIRPDFLSLGAEPGTEEAFTGHDLSVANHTWFMNYALAGMDREGILVGGGGATWEDPAYVWSLAANTSLDYIDLHVYPLRSATTSFLQRALDFADIARAYGKRVGMSEAWLYKARSNELGLPATSGDIFARDVFSLWEPVDKKFLTAMVGLAHFKRLEFMSPFWSKYLFATVEYNDETRQMTAVELLRLADQAAVDAIVAGRYSGTGEHYARLIDPPPAAVNTVTIEPEGGRVDWSAAHDLIAYDRVGWDGYTDVWLMSPDGSGKTPLTPGLAGLPTRHVGNPSWHPDGYWIVLQAEKQFHAGGSGLSSPGLGMNNDLWVVGVDRTRVHRLTDIPDGEWILHPHFSHDGRRLQWAETRAGASDWTIKIADFVVDPSGAHLANVQTLRPGQPADGRWYETHGFSPDDAWILFSANLEPGQHYTGCDQYACHVATGTLVRLTDTLSIWDEHGHYSPDGRWIVWMSSAGYSFNPFTLQGVRTDFWIMRSNGLSKTRLTFYNETLGPVVCADLAWSPDGRRFVGRVGAAGGGDSGGSIVLVTLD